MSKMMYMNCQLPMECGHNIWQSWEINKLSGKSFHYYTKYNLKNITYQKTPCYS